MQIFIQDLSNLFNMHLLLFFFKFFYAKLKSPFLSFAGSLMPFAVSVSIRLVASALETFLPDIVFFTGAGFYSDLGSCTVLNVGIPAGLFQGARSIKSSRLCFISRKSSQLLFRRALTVNLSKEHCKCAFLFGSLSVVGAYHHRGS